MPPALHPYLKRGLLLDSSPVDPRHLVHDTTAAHHSPQSTTAKRRRVEAIALQYLRGRPPLILTARLKGPFTKEWQNPWAEHSETRPLHVASPETSRAATHTEEDLHSDHDLKPLPATAPLPDEDNTPATAAFFSVGTEQFVANNSPTNPFWLRRPDASIGFPPNSQTDNSPTRPRTKDHRFNSRKSLHLASPKGPLGRRQLPIRATPPDMPDSSLLRADSAQQHEAQSSQVAQAAQEVLTATTPSILPDVSTAVSSGTLALQPVAAQSFDSVVPATTYKVSSTVQVPQSSPNGARADISKSAEQLPNLMSKPAEQQQQQQQQPPSPVTYKPAKDVGPSRNMRHDLVASPAPASSTGFMYRRVGQTKGENENVARTKPRAVNFSSSPTLKRTGPVQADVDSEQRAPPVDAELAVGRVSLPAVEAVGLSTTGQDKDSSDQEVEEEQTMNQQQESYRSRQSQYSTQAAMLLAQLEFQEDSSQSSASSATLRPWSQPAQTTPPPLLPQPSPAMTPLSVFNVRTDTSFSDLAGDSVLHGPSVSTQDLFEAASPFAFSTVKKRSQPARRSSLRFALASRLGESITTKSPSPCIERIPLKEKNMAAMSSFTDDKPSYALKLTSQSPKRTSQGSELPRLDFNTSLDFDPTAEITADFTECFLRGLDNGL